MSKDKEYKEINIIKERKKGKDIELINENIQDTDHTFVKDIEESSKNADESSEVGIINSKNKSSVLIRDNGDIKLAANRMAQMSINNNDKSINEICQSKNIISNRVSIDTNDIEVNGHKMNQRLWELADQRILLHDEDRSIGNFNVGGYVLMKHWEADLGKYVLIRRRIRMPFFYPEKTLPDIPKQMSMDTEIDLGTQELVGQGSEMINKFFGLSESDPAYQDAESKEEIHVEDHVIDSQLYDPEEETLIDMGPIKSNTGNLIYGPGKSQDESLLGNSILGGSSIPPSNTSTLDSSKIPPLKPGVRSYDLNKSGDIQLSPNLKLSHFKCKDGNPIVIVDPKLVDLIEKVIKKAGSNNFVITSAFRTITHNARVKGASRSQHLYGKAVDITFSNIPADRIKDIALEMGAGYAYTPKNKSFCHFDTR